MIGESLTLGGVAVVMAAIAGGLILAMIVCWIAERADRARWDKLTKQRPYLTKD